MTTSSVADGGWRHLRIRADRRMISAGQSCRLQPSVRRARAGDGSGVLIATFDHGHRNGIPREDAVPPNALPARGTSENTYARRSSLRNLAVNTRIILIELFYRRDSIANNSRSVLREEISREAFLRERIVGKSPRRRKRSATSRKKNHTPNRKPRSDMNIQKSFRRTVNTRRIL